MGQLTTGVQIRASKNNFEITKVLHCQAIYLNYKTQRYFLTSQESVKCFQCFAPLENDCVHYSNSDWLIEPQDCVVIGLSASNICLAQQREIWETGNERVKKRRQGNFSRASHFFRTSLYSHPLNTDKTQYFFFPDLGFPELKNSTPGKFSPISHKLKKAE